MLIGLHRELYTLVVYILLLLAIFFLLNRLYNYVNYVYDHQVAMEKQHKPLLSIDKKPQKPALKRLQRMLLCLQKYDFELHYWQIIKMAIADTPSRDHSVNRHYDVI